MSRIDRKHRKRCLLAALLWLFICFLREMSTKSMSQGQRQTINFALATSARHSKVSCHQAAQQIDVPKQLLSDEQVRHIHAAVRAKCLEAIAVGNLPPGRELELISALDLGTVPWSLLPIKLKEQLGLPLQDKGIDSLALNLSVAVQAKDYSNDNSVPLNRLTNFYFLVDAKGSPLRNAVQQLIVATNENTTLPQQWHWSEAEHRGYTSDEMELWREKARLAQKEVSAANVPKQTWKRWPHQVECLKRCRRFLKHKSKRDFYVQMATGTGKSMVMADLLAGLRPGRRACIIVPKLDLMEQLAQLLEETLPSRIARVGTGWLADLSADIFVCVRNSAWQLSNVTFDLLILDEAHHYEPLPQSDEFEHITLGIHAEQVLSLNAPKRIFFTATLLKNEADFNFGLRPAITAGIIKDYAVMVPVLSEGDPRPGLIEIIQNLPFSRKILAFCNTVCEAKQFTKMLCAAGIPADHYNGSTNTMRRKEILESFQLSESRGGIRVLVTVDVLSEGVDLPVADTCLFVAPRRGVRLQQCVGRVLRNHSEKVDALVIAPPVVQHGNGSLIEDEELSRLLGELALSDPMFQTSLGESESTNNGRVGVLANDGGDPEGKMVEQVACVLQVCLFPQVLDLIHNNCRGSWERGFAALKAYEKEHGNVLVRRNYKTSDGFGLGWWVNNQRSAEKRGTLGQEKKHQLDQVGFVWGTLHARHTWEQSFQKLLDYEKEHGNVLVPQSYKTSDGFGLGWWVNNQRSAEKRGTLGQDKKHQLEQVGFVWMTRRAPHTWAQGLRDLLAYKKEHGHVLVPYNYKTSDGFGLGRWVNNQRSAEKRGTLGQDKKHQLEQVGFVWMTRRAPHTWAQGLRDLLAYKKEHGHVLVPYNYKTSDGFGLGRWVRDQRSAERLDKLGQDEKHRLEQVGFVWMTRHAKHTWEQSFQKLLAYKKEHGHVLVPYNYKTLDGFGLGQWVNNQRSAERLDKLGQDKKHQLEQVGFVWMTRHAKHTWEQSFQKLLAYKKEHGNVLVPQSYKTSDGFGLGRWVRDQRSAERLDKLGQDEKHRLEQVGFVWMTRHAKHTWEQSFQKLLAYKKEHGHVLVPYNYKTSDGFGLGRWVNNKRSAERLDKLGQDKKHQLEQVGFVWMTRHAKHTWEQSFQKLLAYKKEHGHVLVPYSYKTSDGFGLGRWVRDQRSAERLDKLGQDKKHQHEQVGFVWEIRHSQHTWEQSFHSFWLTQRNMEICLCCPTNYDTKHLMDLPCESGCQDRGHQWPEANWAMCTSSSFIPFDAALLFYGGQCLTATGGAAGVSLLLQFDTGSGAIRCTCAGEHREEKKCAKSNCFKLFFFFFFLLYLRPLVPRFSYMIEQLTAAKSLRPEHALATYYIILCQ